MLLLSAQLLLTLCANNEANAGSISALLLTSGTAFFSFICFSSFVRLAIVALGYCLQQK